MTITARYATVCPCCSQPIAPGAQVEWAKGSPAKHVACAGGSRSPVAARIATRMATPSRGGKWTGCSCGSREDSYGDLIPARNNCSSCRHDA